MIAVRLRVIDYDKGSNTYTAQLLNGDLIVLDPFVSCAISMTDEEYAEDKGFDIVGNDYLLTEYIVYKYAVMPVEGGMIAI